MDRVIAALLLMFALVSPGRASAQTILETFETATNGAFSFTSSGVLFNILNPPAFRVQGNFPGTGWNGGVIDNKYIDNSGNVPASNAQLGFNVQEGLRFRVVRFWLFLSTINLNQNVTGSVTVTGKLDGENQFTFTKTSGFATSLGSTNGYTLIDLSNFSGQNYSNIDIDEIQITTGGAYTYMGLDALTWTKVAPTNFSIGGVVNGLATGSHITLGTGAQSVTVNANGAFTFPTQVATGTSYSVAITGQSATPRQFCTVTNGTGVVGTSSVTNVAVNCANTLQLQLDDGDQYIHYGESRDYVLTLTNSTLANATDVTVAASMSDAFDLNASSWKCLSSGNSGVICNGNETQGSLGDKVSVPAGASVQWLIKGVVMPTTSAGTADLFVLASFANAAVDNNTLVLFRNGFGADGSAGIELPAAQAASVLGAEETYTFDSTPAPRELIDTLLSMKADIGIVRVQRLNATQASWLRLQWLSDGKTIAGDWMRATSNAPLTIGSMDVDGNRIILLDGAGISAQLPLIKH